MGGIVDYDSAALGRLVSFDRTVAFGAIGALIGFEEVLMVEALGLSAATVLVGAAALLLRRSRHRHRSTLAEDLTPVGRIIRGPDHGALLRPPCIRSHVPRIDGACVFRSRHPLAEPSTDSQRAYVAEVLFGH